MLLSISSAILALSTLVPSAAAMPTWGQQPNYKNPNLAKLQSIMPKSTLPAPDNLRLKFVGLGIGTQNYTCLAGEVVPGTTGAVGQSTTHHFSYNP